MAALVSQVESGPTNPPTEETITFRVPEISEIMATNDLDGSFNEPLPDHYLNFVREIARTGSVHDDWGVLKKIYALRMIQVCM
jgi:hypothetical protein